MRVNADFDQPVTIATDEMPWVPSPLAGVERRMLDRIGAEVARATSLVRYAPGSFFDPHTHHGGEEFLVIDGVFSDEHGDYGPGTYVRNPVGSAHKPFSKGGCTIFVKLWQMAPEDQDFVRIQINETLDRTKRIDGVKHAPLVERDYETVSVFDLAPGARITVGGHGGAELLVLPGQLHWDGQGLSTGAWSRLPDGQNAELKALTSARVYLKTGHLAGPITAPPQP